MTNKKLAELDLAVAKAEGFWKPADTKWREHLELPNGNWVHAEDYQPTRDGAEAMRLLEKYQFEMYPPSEDCPDGWCAGLMHKEKGWVHAVGPTPAIAICRAVVALKEKP